MTWGSLNGEIFMPWYFLASDGNAAVGYGVKTGANAFDKIKEQTNQKGLIFSPYFIYTPLDRRKCIRYNKRRTNLPPGKNGERKEL
jgi:hypothetical protein